MLAISAHPAGEVKTAPHYPAGTWPLDTPGGRFYAEWDDQSPVTREGQPIFFFQFLQGGGRWSAFLRDCLLHYKGNRGSGAINFIGTVLLSVLSGHWRYAHINSLRGDGINPRLLGMSSTVSEDAVRQAMGRIEEVAGLDWISTQILGYISPALCLLWTLDIDVAVKPLYGRHQLDPVAFPAIVMPKHYCDRADAENCFGELKNRWGWSGFTSHKLFSSRLMANLIALVYNWWNLYGRFYDKEHHR